MSDSAFARVMEARRGYFNARFAQAQIRRPDLDGDAFLEVLRQDVAPVVEAVAQGQADAALVAGQHLYDLALDLFADGLLVPEHVDAANIMSLIGKPVNAAASVQYPLRRVWREVLPGMARFLAIEPRRVAGSVLNAAYNIAQTPGARPEQWGEIMRAVAPFCGDTEMLLRVGQVAAWRAGMAHFRLGALQILKALDGKIVRTIFGLEANAAQPDTSALHHALMANPWYDPAAELDANGGTERTPFRSPPLRSLRIAGRVGAFRGFDGAFLSPPRVTWTREGFVASDGEENYLLTADTFGATLRRVDGVRAETTAMPFKLGRDGQVTYGEVRAKFPELANATSSTANQTTLAVTTELTHAVVLVALA